MKERTVIQFRGKSEVRRPICITRIEGTTAWFVFLDEVSSEEGQLRDRCVEQLVVGKEYTIAGAALDPPKKLSWVFVPPRGEPN